MEWANEERSRSANGPASEPVTPFTEASLYHPHRRMSQIADWAAAWAVSPPLPLKETPAATAFSAGPDACSPSELVGIPSLRTEDSPSTTVHQEPTTASPVCESSTEAHRTAEYLKEVLGLNEGGEPRHETVLRRSSPTIGAIPHTGAQTFHTTALLADQTSTEAYRAVSVSSEAFDEDERPSKRHCDPTPRFACPLCSKSYTRPANLKTTSANTPTNDPFAADSPGAVNRFLGTTTRRGTRRSIALREPSNVVGVVWMDRLGVAVQHLRGRMDFWSIIIGPPRVDNASQVGMASRTRR